MNATEAERRPALRALELDVTSEKEQATGETGEDDKGQKQDRHRRLIRELRVLPVPLVAAVVHGERAARALGRPAGVARS